MGCTQADFDAKKEGQPDHAGQTGGVHTPTPKPIADSDIQYNAFADPWIKSLKSGYAVFVAQLSKVRTQQLQGAGILENDILLLEHYKDALNAIYSEGETFLKERTERFEATKMDVHNPRKNAELLRTLSALFAKRGEWYMVVGELNPVMAMHQRAEACNNWAKRLECYKGNGTVRMEVMEGMRVAYAAMPLEEKLEAIRNLAAVDSETKEKLESAAAYSTKSHSFV